MKILLTQNLPYVPTVGGANKAARALVEALAARGHECCAIAPWVADAAGDPTRTLDELAKRGIRADFVSAEVVVFRHRGVEVHAVAGTARIVERLREQVHRFAPTWVVVGSEDPGQLLLEAALEVAPDRVISLVQTTQMLPFGPESFLELPRGTALFRQTAGVVAISTYLQEYLQRWGGLASTVLPLPVYGAGPFRQLGEPGRGRVTMINPCAVKGITVFLELARRRPAVAFAAVPTWGTSGAELAELRALPNVEVLPPQDDIERILEQTSVLIVPSLWAETFGYVAVEAMLRGIPVLASALGGLTEAKLGVEYVLPVQPITAYEPVYDEFMRPRPVVPPQEVAPWLAALDRLLADPAHYREVAGASRAAAHAFLERADARHFEAYLQTLPPAPLPAVESSRATDAVQTRLAALSPARRALLALRLADRRRATARRTAIPPLPRTSATANEFPLSFAQQRLWFLDRLVPGSAAYHMPVAIRMRGSLDRAALERAFEALSERHESLRTTFALKDGVPVQRIGPPTPVPVAELDLGALAEDAREAEVVRVVRTEAARPFDLERDAPLRVLLVRLGERDHVLTVTMHHIVSDGWSGGLFVRELAALYRAFLARQPSPLPALPVQYADYAVWQRTHLSGEILATQLAYWLRQLAELPTLTLPWDRPRPPVQSFRGSHRPLEIPRALGDALQELARREGVTLFMVLLAAFQVLLARYSGEERIPVGTPIANRDRPESEGLIGFFANTLVLCTDLGGNPSFRRLLGRVREVTLGAYAHQDLPFEKLVEELQPGRELTQNPLFQVVFALQNAPLDRLELPGLTLSPLKLDLEVTRFDLECHLWERPEGLRGLLVYSTDLFEEETIERMCGHFQTLLAGIAADPDCAIAALPLLTEEERNQCADQCANQCAEPLPDPVDLDALLRAIENLPAILPDP